MGMSYGSRWVLRGRREGSQQTYAAFFRGFAGRWECVGRETTLISKAAPSAVAARDTESMVMVGLAGSRSEWTAIRLVPIRRAISEIEMLPARRA